MLAKYDPAQRKGGNRMKLYDSELRVLQVLWENGDMRAARVCDVLKDEVGWNPNTTYTVIKKCIQKGYVERTDPGFWCHPLLSKQTVGNWKMEELIDKLFNGSGLEFFCEVVESGKYLTEEERQNIHAMLREKIC